MHLKKKHIEAMKKYSWPGNVRELQNVIERAVIISQGRTLRLDIPEAVSSIQADPSNIASGSNSESLSVDSYDELESLERQMILSALRDANGKISGKVGAAAQLGVHPSTLTSKMASMGIKRKQQIDFE